MSWKYIKIVFSYKTCILTAAAAFSSLFLPSSPSLNHFLFDNWVEYLL